MKSTSTLALILMVSTNVMAAKGTSVKKIMDGSTVFCRTTLDASDKKHVKIQVQGEQLLVQVVNCRAQSTEHGVYVVDANPQKSVYTTANGITVEEQFTNYELVVVEGHNYPEYKIIESISLSKLETTGSQLVDISNSIKDVQSGVKKNHAEIFVRAVHTVKASNGVSFKQYIAWGSYRY